jgi:hypothetical protein
MSVTILTPIYSHRKVSDDEKAARRIADALDPAEILPQKCGDCGASGSIRNPLMMKPLFRMDHGGPKGTLYKCRCADCQTKRVRRH